MIRRRATLALLVAASLACAAPPPSAEAPPGPLLPSGSRVRLLEVVPDPERLSASDRELLADGEVASRVRQGALDALEQRRRFDPQGDATVRVRLVQVRLRSRLTTLLLSHRAGADQLTAEVDVERGGAPVGMLRIAATTALGGLEWRDPEKRLQRLARELARRISERL